MTRVSDKRRVRKDADIPVNLSLGTQAVAAADRQFRVTSRHHNLLGVEHRAVHSQVANLVHLLGVEGEVGGGEEDVYGARGPMQILEEIFSWKQFLHELPVGCF